MPHICCQQQSTVDAYSTLVTGHLEADVEHQTVVFQVVHSDLKALNILLTRGWEVAKIGDVGVARFMHAKDGSNEVAMGTFAYAAPETLLGIDSGVKVRLRLRNILGVRNMLSASFPV